MKSPKSDVVPAFRNNTGTEFYFTFTKGQAFEILENLCLSCPELKGLVPQLPTGYPSVR